MSSITPEQQRNNAIKSDRAMVKRVGLIVTLLIAAAVLVIAVLLVIASILLGRTGFETKTLWDWMELLIVPLAIGLGVALFNNLQQRRQDQLARTQAEADSRLAQERADTETKLALDRIREDRLQAYLAAMKELLLDYDLRTSSPRPEVRQIARTLTVTVLLNLDGQRKSALLVFLRDLKLISGTDPIVGLSWANLSRADLSEVDLTGANLRRAYLTEANLSGAYLSKANLSEADLTGADLTGADHLTEANLRNAVYDDTTKWPDGFDYVRSGAAGPRAELSGADLREAELTGADLSKSNLSKADLTGVDLSGANLSGANLSEANLSGARYDDATKWPDGFDPVAAGAKKVGQEPSA